MSESRSLRDDNKNDYCKDKNNSNGKNKYRGSSLRSE